jgi:hypothetical protein
MGAFVSRRSWQVFRRRFDELRLRPFLDYAVYRQNGTGEGVYRFIGGVESLTDDHTLWIRDDNLTIPVALAGAQTYMLPMPETGDPEVFDPGEGKPERVRWDRVSTLTEGAKVFVGGSLVFRENRRIFVSTRDAPLLVIFYDGPDRSLTPRTIRAARDRNEYWNTLTPYAFILGIFSQLLIVLSFLSRPWFRQTVIAAFIALFTPLYPVIPPGVLCTVAYRHLWWRARLLRAYRDLVRLPLRYFPPGAETCRLPDGELYGFLRLDTLPPEALERGIPFLIPREEARKKGDWYIYGALGEEPSAGAGNSGGGPAAGPEPAVIPSVLPVATPLVRPSIKLGKDGTLLREPRDVFAPYGAIPGNPKVLARRYNRQAYILEIISLLLLLTGLALNIFFFALIFFLLLYRSLVNG